MSLYLRYDEGLLALKTIKVSDETCKELGKLGTWGKTMDDIIAKCIKSYKKESNI
jgi:predicted CopG family antitoxin